MENENTNIDTKISEKSLKCRNILSLGSSKYLQMNEVFQSFPIEVVEIGKETSNSTRTLIYVYNIFHKTYNNMM